MEMMIPILFSVIDVSALLYFVKKALDIKGLKITKFVIALVIQIVVNTIINKIFGYGNPIGFIIMAAAAILAVSIIFKAKVVPSFIIVFIGLVLLLLTDGISVAIIGAVLQENLYVFFSNPLFLLGGTLFSKSMFYVIAIMIISKIIVKKELMQKIDLGRSSNNYIIAVILLFNSLLIYTIIFIMRFSDIQQSNQMKFVQIGVVFMVAFTIFISYILTKNVGLISKEIEWEYKEELLKEQQIYVENINDVMTALRAQNHDFNHHIGCLYGLVETNESDELKKYIKNLVDDAIEYDTTVYSQNKVFNSIINISIQKAVREKIVVDTKIDLHSEINIDFIDYSIIFGNIMNNAIEACKQVDNDKYIVIKVYEKNENIIVKVNNTKNESISLETNDDGTYKTTKEINKDNHGYGMKNIVKTVEKYHGSVRFIDQQTSFEVQIAIPI